MEHIQLLGDQKFTQFLLLISHMYLTDLITEEVIQCKAQRCTEKDALENAVIYVKKLEKGINMWVFLECEENT